LESDDESNSNGNWDMEDKLSFVVVRENDVRFWLNVKPRSAREHFGLDAHGELRLQVRAPAADGKANEACIDFLARLLRAPRSSIEIVMGDRSRRKLIRILGGVEIAQKLKSEVGGALSIMQQRLKADD
jgi:uncharacterized protein (TIGR00251 family)